MGAVHHGCGGSWGSGSSFEATATAMTQNDQQQGEDEKDDDGDFHGARTASTLTGPARRHVRGASHNRHDAYRKASDELWRDLYPHFVRVSQNRASEHSYWQWHPNAAIPELVPVFCTQFCDAPHWMQPPQWDVSQGKKSAQ
jgi:hypothetical protein